MIIFQILNDQCTFQDFKCKRKIMRKLRSTIRARNYTGGRFCFKICIFGDAILLSTHGLET